MTPYELLAEAFCYPYPELLETLQTGLAAMPKGPARTAFSRFVNAIARLTPEAWEEVHTQTLDLSPAAAPYIGFQIWGENYQRGVFMAKMNRALYELDIDCAGELPDHLTPILRYLSAAPAPLPALLENFEPAVQKMQTLLRQSSPKNPYLHLFEAALQAFQAVQRRQPAAV